MRVGDDDGPWTKFAELQLGKSQSTLASKTGDQVFRWKEDERSVGEV